MQIIGVDDDMIIVKRGLISDVWGGYREMSKSAVGGGLALLLYLTVLVEMTFSSSYRMQWVGGDHGAVSR